MHYAVRSYQKTGKLFRRKVWNWHTLSEHGEEAAARAAFARACQRGYTPTRRGYTLVEIGHMEQRVIGSSFEYRR